MGVVHSNSRCQLAGATAISIDMYNILYIRTLWNIWFESGSVQAIRNGCQPSSSLGLVQSGEKSNLLGVAPFSTKGCLQDERDVVKERIVHDASESLEANLPLANVLVPIQVTPGGPCEKTGLARCIVL